MIIAHTGIVRRIYKTHADNWCIEIKRTGTQAKGVTKYIGFKSKPNVSAGIRFLKGRR